MAAPVLARYDYVGVLNLKADNILPKGGLTLDQVRSLISRGWEIAAHTLHHKDLTTLALTQLKKEVAGSRRDLEALFHVPVDFFCYPAGRFDNAVVAEVKAAGFLGATTTVEGMATHTESPFELPRVRVSGGESLARFVALLRST